MAEDKKIVKKPHSVVMDNRSCISITGVNDVGSFNEETVTVATDYGELSVKGRQLHISRLNLDSGELSIDGTVIALVYSDNQPQSGGLFSKLFR